jgi:hypothetical protein
MGDPVEKVSNSVCADSSKWIFNISTSSYMAVQRNCVSSCLPCQDNVVLAHKTQVECTGFNFIRLSSRLRSGDISVVLLYRVLFVRSLQKSVYSWNSGISIGKCAMINDEDLQVFYKLDSSLVINTS